MVRGVSLHPVAECHAMGQPARAAVSVWFPARLRGLSFRHADTDAGRVVMDRPVK